MSNSPPGPGRRAFNATVGAGGSPFSSGIQYDDQETFTLEVTVQIEEGATDSKVKVTKVQDGVTQKGVLNDDTALSAGHEYAFAFQAQKGVVYDLEFVSATVVGEAIMHVSKSA